MFCTPWVRCRLRRCSFLLFFQGLPNEKRSWHQGKTLFACAVVATPPPAAAWSTPAIHTWELRTERRTRTRTQGWRRCLRSEFGLRALCSVYETVIARIMVKSASSAYAASGDSYQTNSKAMACPLGTGRLGAGAQTLLKNGFLLTFLNLKKVLLPARVSILGFSQQESIRISSQFCKLSMTTLQG